MAELVGAVCVDCGTETAVLESRKGDAEPVMIWRTRKCKNQACGALFTTVEAFAPDQQIPHEVRAQAKLRKRAVNA